MEIQDINFSVIYCTADIKKQCIVVYAHKMAD